MKRLYRSRNNYVIAGVCGGIGEYFEVDPTLVRLAFACMLLLAGTGLLFYLIAWTVIPVNPT